MTTSKMQKIWLGKSENIAAWPKGTAVSIGHAFKKYSKNLILSIRDTNLPFQLFFCNKEAESFHISLLSGFVEISTGMQRSWVV